MKLTKPACSACAGRAPLYDRIAFQNSRGNWYHYRKDSQFIEHAIACSGTAAERRKAKGKTFPEVPVP